MKPVETARLPRISTLAFHVACAAAIAAGVTALSTVISGCAPCDKPEGCSAAPKPQVTVTLTPRAGTYDGQQLVSIVAPNASAIYFSTNGTTPGTSNCSVWDGNPIAINDSTVLRVYAYADGTSYRSRSVKAEYKLTSSPYTNRTALNNWVALEKSALTALYCANNNCVVPTPDFLLTEQHWSASCPDGGSVSFDNDPSNYQSVFTYNGCSGHGITADGAVTLTLDVARLPAVSIIGSDGVIVSGAGYTANIADNTLRKYTLLGTEGDRAGGYTVNCAGAGCATGEVRYYYGTKNALWIDDPAVPNSCTP
jgi:hypothetical protein